MSYKRLCMISLIFITLVRSPVFCKARFWLKWNSFSDIFLYYNFLFWGKRGGSEWKCSRSFSGCYRGFANAWPGLPVIGFWLKRGLSGRCGTGNIASGLPPVPCCISITPNLVNLFSWTMWIPLHIAYFWLWQIHRSRSFSPIPCTLKYRTCIRDKKDKAFNSKTKRGH